MSTEVPPPDTANSKEVVETTAPCPVCHSVTNPNSTDWICCDVCSVWYHEICEGLTVVPNDEKPYICNSCRKKSIDIRCCDI